MHEQQNISAEKPVLRIDAGNPNHHLWNNNGTWFLHYTVHCGHIAERRRVSLKTRKVVLARRRRDAFFAKTGVAA